MICCIFYFQKAPAADIVLPLLCSFFYKNHRMSSKHMLCLNCSSPGRERFSLFNKDHRTSSNMRLEIKAIAVGRICFATPWMGGRKLCLSAQFKFPRNNPYYFLFSSIRRTASQFLICTKDN